MKSVAALLFVGMLILWTELPAGSAWSCPPVRFICAMVNPPNQCFFDWQCSRPKKCCNTFCGKKCISRPPAFPIFHV
ncbi:caltrin-like protein 2 [Apteryx rowi]|uniref:caltrin-like protein 2 n=1 Tax=Apteryx rowi TaxID=308060 RepID=UPI0006B0A2E8|nr:PREDICTED: caltrin-like protein 2 [Apteryx mantelli mantelli]XP_025932595.1 caltrin-like protein 2 [Apteryx rowi]